MLLSFDCSLFVGKSESKAKQNGAFVVTFNILCVQFMMDVAYNETSYLRITFATKQYIYF